MASGASLLIFTALHNSPPATNPATFNVRNGTPVLEFDTTTQESAIFVGVLPRSYAGLGITVYLHWAAATANSSAGGVPHSTSTLSSPPVRAVRAHGHRLYASTTSTR